MSVGISKLVIVFIILVALTGSIGGIVYFSKQTDSKESPTSRSVMFSAQGKGIDAEIKSALNGMRADVEIVYDRLQSYDSICRNGEINTSEQVLVKNVGNILRAKQSQDQKSANMTCLAHKEKYVISVFLDYAGQEYCVDSSGRVGFGSVNVSTLQCAI